MSEQAEALKALGALYERAMDAATGPAAFVDDRGAYAVCGPESAWDSGDEAAKEAWSAFGRYLARLRADIEKARRRLVETGFDVPVSWLGFAAVGRRSQRHRRLDGAGYVVECRYHGADVDALRTACQEIRASSMKLSGGGVKPAARPDPPATTANDARDKWLYEQSRKLVPYATIRLRLRKRKRWAAIDSDAGVKLAAGRYAARHNLPPIPSRQPGRPAKKTTQD